MDYQTLFLPAAALLILLDMALLSMSGLSDKQKGKYGFSAMVFAFCLIMFSYVMFLRAFLDNDFSLVSVYSYSSSGTPLLSKIYASWAGAGGSMLFLTFLLSIFYFGMRLQSFKKFDKFSVKACQVFSFVLLIFLVVCLLRNPFERFPGVPLEGMGLNPQLQSLWMAIHPPIVFCAYAFVVLAYTLTLASIKYGRELVSSKLFTISVYAGWLLLTLGIALGGVWAYEVQGWGGYWAWDPVETASLLPWLFLTAYFLVERISNRSSLTREFMILTVFSSLVFLSALTRGGFKQSIHSYAASAVGPVMLAFALVMIAYFFYLKKGRPLPLLKFEVNKASLSSRSFFVGFWSLIFIAVVCLVGLAFSNFPYNYGTFPFVFIFVISLIGFSLDEKTHYVRVLLIVLAALGTGIALSLVGLIGVNVLTTLTTPLLIVAFLALLIRILKAVKQKSLHFIGTALLNLAIIVLLLGIFISAGAKNTITVQKAEISTPIDALQLRIELVSLTISNSSSKVYSEQADAFFPEYSSIDVIVTIRQMEKIYEGTLTASFYSNYGLLLKPLIMHTETGDLYLHLEYSDSLYEALTETLIGKGIAPEDVSVTIQKVPMVYLVWAGVALMLIGVSIQLAANLTKKAIIS